MTSFSFSQLEALWQQQGGAPAAAPMAAAVALAESSGNSDDIGGPNKNGSFDYGLWQINNGGDAMLDPASNARRAVQMSGNGQNWRPWCTAWSDNACGTKGGTYLGAGAGFMKYLSNSPGTLGGVDLGPSDAPAGSGQRAPYPDPTASPTANPASAGGDNPCKIGIPAIPIFPGIDFLGLHIGTTHIGPYCLFSESQGRALLGVVSMVTGGFVMLVGFGLVLGTELGGSLARAAVKKVAPGVASQTQPARARSPRASQADVDAEIQRRANAARAPRTTVGGKRVVGRSVSAEEVDELETSPEEQRRLAQASRRRAA